MRRSVPCSLLFVSTFLLAGCLRGCGRGEAPPEVPGVPAETEQPSVPQGEAGTQASSPTGEDRGGSGGEAVPPVATEPVPEIQREPVFIPQALTWTLGAHDLLTKAGKLLAIQEGRYELRAGEEPPDLRRMYAALHGVVAAIDASHKDEKLRSMMRDLDDALGAIINGLSQPPTVAELRSVLASKQALWPKIDGLYKYLESLRREALTATSGR